LTDESCFPHQRDDAQPGAQGGEQDQAQFERLLDVSIVKDRDPQSRRKHHRCNHGPLTPAVTHCTSRVPGRLEREQEHDHRCDGSGESRAPDQTSGPTQRVGQRRCGEQWNQPERAVVVVGDPVGLRRIDEQGMTGHGGFG